MSGHYNIWGSDDFLQLKFKGTTDLDDLRSSCMDWFSKRKFDFHEHFVKAKQPTPVGEEVFWRWMAFRNLSEYLRFQMDIHWHFWDLEPIEVMQNGKKKKLYKGRVSLILKGKLITDYGERFETNAFKSALREFMDKYILLPKLHNWSSHCEYLTHDLYTMIKEKLGMKLYDTAYKGVR